MSTPTTPKPTLTKTATKTFTLNDLAKIALGAPELSREHLSVLQSLLLILLRKLNCHNETVRIHGFSAKCLQKKLNETPTDCQYDFHLQTVKGFKEKYELLEKLEQRLQESQMKLEEHYKQIRTCHKTFIFKAENWDFYAASSEDLCTLYMTHNKDFCLMARNPVFNKALRVRMAQPIVDGLKNLETKVEQMQSKLQDLTEKAKKVAEKLNYLKYIIKDIEVLRPFINKCKETFRGAMTETQEMLNCKLDRVTLPAIKKYLDERFLIIEEHLKFLKKEDIRCDPCKALKIEEKTCLSCTRHDELKHLRDIKPIKSVNEDEKCLCKNIAREPTILEKVDRIAAKPFEAGITAALFLSKHNIDLQEVLKTENFVITKPLLKKTVEKERKKVVSVNRKPSQGTAKGSKKISLNDHTNTGEVTKLRKIKSVRINRYHYGT